MSAGATLTSDRGTFRLRARPGGTPLGAIFGAILAVLTVAVGLLHLDRLPMTLCLFKAATGFPCATCGTTRTLGRLFQLDLPGAFEMNPLAAAVLLALVPWALLDVALMLRGGALRMELPQRFQPALRIGIVVAVILNWAYLLLAGR